MAAAKKISALNRIRQFLEQNVGERVTTHQIAEVAQIRDYQRRIRDLRNDEGMQIQSYRDREDLRPDEYILVSLERHPRFSHRIDQTQRARILERNGLTCQMCGATSGDPDSYQTGKKVRLHVDHVDPDGESKDDNLRTLCSNCNEGRSNLVIPPSPNTLTVLRTIRRLSRSDQRRIYEELKKKYDANP